jgi:putative MATE family efflux protein
MSERKTFYRNLFVLVGPIALQNLISAAVNSADVIMLGYVGQTALAASSLAGQVQFILNLFFVGVSSGLTMLIAQYWGKGDTHSIQVLMGIGFKVASFVALIFACATFFFPKPIMTFFTKDPELIEAGASYLSIVGISYVFMSFSQVYQAVLKSIERVRSVTVIVFIALGTNIFLNAVFIFGLFGAPKMGIVGVAIATVIARFIELIISIICGKTVSHFEVSIRSIFKSNPVLLRDFFHFSLPAMGNEFVWGAAFAMYSVILGHLGSDIVAANSVVTVARNLAGVVCFGMAYGGAFILGKEIGNNEIARAKKDAGRLCFSTIMAGILGGLLILCIRPIMFNIADLTAVANKYLSIMLYINAIYIVGQAINTVIICGAFRSGGDARFGFILDTIIMWGVSVPLGLLAAFVFKLPPIGVYIILCLDELEKMPFVIAHYKSGKWMKNITRDFSHETEIKNT